MRISAMPLRNSTVNAVNVPIHNKQRLHKCRMIRVSWQSRHCLRKEQAARGCEKERALRNVVAATAAMTAATIAAATIVAATIAAALAAATAANRVAAAATSAAAHVVVTAAIAARAAAIAAARSRKTPL